MSGYSQQLSKIDRAVQLLEAQRFRTLEKAAKSDSPNDILTAAKTLSQMQQKGANVDPKSYLIDPLDFNSQLGYKDKAFSLTYTTLQRMSRVPIINSIIKTRKNQVADFAEPQVNRYNTGFVIQRKAKDGGETPKMNSSDKKIAHAITDFLLSGGNRDTWDKEDFDVFVRKVMDDSLIYDQMTWECVRNNRGQLVRFDAVDAATFRLADSYFKSSYNHPFFDQNSAWKPDRADVGKPINGYLPHYVQVYQTQKVGEYYPWELCFGMRNPSTNVHANGYGRSELEDLINIVTSMLWGDEYNRRFFSQGSAPKGLLKINKGLTGAALEQFKQQWQAMVTGVMQSWKTPVVEADVDWIDLQKNNRDMEYTNWIEYLIKLSCAIYSIDPSEIGWDISRSSGQHGMFEGSQKERLRHSKDKGLYPLLKFLQRKINKYVVEQLNPDFELVFMGLNGMTIEQELEMDVKKISNFETLNEIREKWDLKPLEDGDIVLNSIYYQQRAAAQQQAMMGGEMGMDGGEEGGANPFDEWALDDEEGKNNAGPSESGNPFDEFSDDIEEAVVSDALTKAFDNFLKTDSNE